MSEITKCQQFLRDKHKFQYFVDDYFPNKMVVLEELAKDGKEAELLNELNDIWFRLPDGEFNIMNNPTGWMEFLDIMED